MSLQSFFDEAPRIRMHDALGQFLGASDDGMVEFRYTDAVRMAGHSCPTVASAYLMARAALKLLYPNGTAERGDIEVTMMGREDQGTMGVIGQVFTLITGAAADNGFHGIGGRFVRSGLLSYGGTEEDCIARFRRVDTGEEVAVSLDLSIVPPAPSMRELMSRAMGPNASDEDRKAFGEVWQERVRRLLLEFADDDSVILAERRV